jgi:hypothetical protein
MAILPATALPGRRGSAHLWLATPNVQGNRRAARIVTEDQTMCRRVRLTVRLRDIILDVPREPGVKLIPGAHEAVVQPWQLRPRDLISWLDMLAFSAEKFFWCGAKLREIRCHCYLGSMIAANGQPGVQLSRDLDAAARDKVVDDLPYVVTQFRELGLAIAADTTVELIQKVQQADQRRSLEWLLENIGAIESIAFKELKNKLFLYVPPERAKFWPAPTHPLGDATAAKFPSASPDIFSAGTCLTCL